MPKLRFAFALLLLCLTCIGLALAEVQVKAGHVFSVTQQNGNVILPEGFSSTLGGVTYLPGNYSEGEIYAWYFPMFTLGNGTTNLSVSAQNCNLTVTSFNQSRLSLPDYWANYTYRLSGTVEGDGVALLNVMGFDYSQTTVLLNGEVHVEGDGWNQTSFGLTIQGPAEFTVTSNSQDYEAPRDAPHDSTLLYASVLVAVLAVAFLVVVAVFRFRRPLKRQN